MRRAADNPTQYAVTGTLAAASWAPYAPARSAMIYTTDAEHTAQLWDLRPADAGANVMLAEPESDVVFIRTLDRRFRSHDRSTTPSRRRFDDRPWTQPL